MAAHNKSSPLQLPTTCQNKLSAVAPQAFPWDSLCFTAPYKLSITCVPRDRMTPKAADCCSCPGAAAKHMRNALYCHNPLSDGCALQCGTHLRTLQPARSATHQMALHPVAS